MKKIITIIFSVLFLFYSQTVLLSYDFTSEYVIPCESFVVCKLNVKTLFSNPISSVILNQLLQDSKIQEVNRFLVDELNFDIKNNLNCIYFVSPENTFRNEINYFVLDGNFDIKKITMSAKATEDVVVTDYRQGIIWLKKKNKINNSILLLSNKCIVITNNPDWFVDNVVNKNYFSFESYQCLMSLSSEYILSGYVKIPEDIKVDIKNDSYNSSWLGDRCFFYSELSDTGYLSLTLSTTYTFRSEVRSDLARNFWTSFTSGLKEGLEKTGKTSDKLFSDFSISFDENVMYWKWQKSLDEIIRVLKNN